MSTVPAATPKTVSVTIPASTTPAHLSRFQIILAAIFAALQAAEPVVVSILPPPVAAGVDVAIAVEPIVVSTVQAVTAADQS